MKSIILYLFFTVLCVNMYGEEMIRQFDPIFSTNTKNIKTGKYKGQVNKGKATGTGVIRLKSGGIYYGDLQDGVPEGYGVLISPEGLKNLNEALVYSGRFKKGIMDGKARCYNSEGINIYEGIFREDKPQQTLTTGSGEGYFICNESGEHRYIGEISSNYALNGRGIIISEDGGYQISNFKDGEPQDILFISDQSGNWQLIKIEDEDLSLISSSEEYATLDRERKAITRQSMQEAFVEISASLNELSNNLQNLSNNLRALSSGADKIGNPTSGNNEMDLSSNKSAENESQEANNEASCQRLYDYWGDRAAHTYKETKPKLKKYEDMLIKEGAHPKHSLVRDANDLFNSNKHVFEDHKKKMMGFYNDAMRNGYKIKVHKMHNQNWDHENPVDVAKHKFKNWKPTM